MKNEGYDGWRRWKEGRRVSEERREKEKAKECKRDKKAELSVVECKQSESIFCSYRAHIITVLSVRVFWRCGLA